MVPAGECLFLGSGVVLYGVWGWGSVEKVRTGGTRMFHSFVHTYTFLPRQIDLNKTPVNLIAWPTEPFLKVSQ